MPREKRLIATWDIETDPFLYGREPRPFCCGLAFQKTVEEIAHIEYKDFWGEDCLEKFYMHLGGIKQRLVIYAHNGGKFDFVYLLRMGLLEAPIKIINGRIVEARFAGHTLRDSYAIIPVPLAAYQKTEIDYDTFEEENREEYKREILDYLKDDCIFLLDLVVAFWERFGDNLTIGGTAIKELKKRCPFDRTTNAHDEIFRPFYYGGRVQCFETGEIKSEKDLLIYDVNSMYPDVMRNYEHFVGDYFRVVSDFESHINYATGELCRNSYKPYFIKVSGKNKGAIPTRAKDGSLNFECDRGTFNVCSHELKIALKYGLFEIEEIHELFIPQDTINFSAYVDEFITDKIEAKENGDKIGELFAKLLLNSAYGKFGQNPRNYFDWVIVDIEGYEERPFSLEIMPVDFGHDFVGPPYRMINAWALYADYGDMEIWRKPAPVEKFFDVSVAASITSAARACLLEAIVNAERPIYCDTDSLMCEKLRGVRLHPTELGAWDLEATGTEAYIAGKKLYTMYGPALKDHDDGLYKKGEIIPLKKACKGVQLNPDEIKNLAMGQSVESHSHAPNFKLTGETEYMQRILGAGKHTKLFDKFGEKINAGN